MKERGVILLSVLWIVMILSVISFSLAAAARTEVSNAGDEFDSSRAFFMARGAAEAVFQQMVEAPDIFTDSPVRVERNEFVFPLETGEVRVRLEAGRSRIDINQAPDVLLASMFDSLSVDTDTRNRLVDAILDWRDADDIPHLYGAESIDYRPGSAPDGRRLPANGPFNSVDELLLVRGFPTGIFHDRLVGDGLGGYRRVPGVRDLVTTQSDTAAVSPNEAPLEVLAALPGMAPEVAVAIRSSFEVDGPFGDEANLVERVPTLADSDALEFLTLAGGGRTSIVARARVEPSGVTRTLRMVLRREERLRILSVTPLFYRRFEEIEFDRWVYE